MHSLMYIDRRTLLLGGGAIGLAGLLARSSSASVQPVPSGAVVSVEQFGARGDSPDNAQSIQAAIDSVERRGGGTVVIAGRYRCGKLTISGHNVRLQGEGGWLVDARITIRPEAANVEIDDLGIVDTRGDRRTYLMDVSGRDCSFRNLQLVKDPVAGGVQMYIRQPAQNCRFTGLRLKGSNGIIMMGRDHLFENFELESAMSKSVGSDDAFAIDALDAVSENIVIRNGSVRGFAAIVSFGSAIGTRGGPGSRQGAVRNVTVENVVGDRCVRLAFFKPDALDYGWREGLVEGIRLRNLTLHDATGERFRAGIVVTAARGATIRDVQARQIRIVARARDRGVAPTAAIDIALRDMGAPARIEDVDLQVAFIDPYSGTPHSAAAPGHPVDYIVRVEKGKSRKGSMSGIVLDVDGRGTSRGGIYVGPDLDGAITVERAILARVSTDPPSSRGGGGIWSNSRLKLGEISIDSVKLPDFGGSAFAKKNP